MEVGVWLQKPVSHPGTFVSSVGIIGQVGQEVILLRKLNSSMDIAIFRAVSSEKRTVVLVGL